MHESCAESGVEAVERASSPTPASGGGRRRDSGAAAAAAAAAPKTLASAATPKEYVSFLRSWFDMHESKKVVFSHGTFGVGVSARLIGAASHRIAPRGGENGRESPRLVSMRVSQPLVVVCR